MPRNLEVIGVWISILVKETGEEFEWPAFQIGPEHTGVEQRADGRNINVTRAKFFSMRQDRDGNTYWMQSDENTRFLIPRVEFVKGLDDLTDAEVIAKLRESTKNLQARAAQNAAVGAGATRVLDLTALAAATDQTSAEGAAPAPEA